MKKFKFTLQPVLEQRKRIEEEKQMVLAKRQHELERAEMELKALNDDFRANSDDVRIHHRQFDTERLRMHSAHLQYLDRAIVAQIRVVAERRLAFERARADLLEASKQKKVVEKLKERRHDAHLTENLRLEQESLDDANARRFGRVPIGGTP